MKTIAIIGSTGMIGRPVTNAFIAAGFKVSVLVRDINKARSFFGNHVNYFLGELEDTAIIEQFLKGQKYLYLNLSVHQESTVKDFQPEREGLANIIEAAKKTSIERIGYLSSLVHQYNGGKGFRWWVFELKKDAVNKIRNCGIPYTIFYPSTFMENFDKGAYRQGSFMLLSGHSRFRMYLISADDFGVQVVNAFEINEGNHEYVIQGENGFTADEAAVFYKIHCRQEKVIIMKFPFGLLRLAGMFNNKYNYGAKMIEALNNFPEKFQASKAWKELGKPQTKFIDYIKCKEMNVM